MTFRLIDDDLSVDNPDYKEFIECYPKFLTLNDTTLPEGVNCVGMNITEGNEGKIKLQVYDKRKDFPFKVVRYPHLDSEIPTNLPYGVFTGLTYRNDRICTETEDFIKESVELAKCLQNQGAKKHRLVSGFTSYLRAKKKKNMCTLRRCFKEALTRTEHSRKTSTRETLDFINSLEIERDFSLDIQRNRTSATSVSRKEVSANRREALDFLNSLAVV